MLAARRSASGCVSAEARRDEARVRTCEMMRTGSQPCTRKRCGAALVVTAMLGLRPTDEGKLRRAAGGIVD